MYCCAWAPNSRALVSGGMDSNLIVWNAQRNTKLNVLAVPQPYTMSVKFAPNSEALAFGGLDCAVYWI